MPGQTTLDEAQDTTGEHLAAAPGPTRVAIDFGAKTHPGKVRPNNEDQFLVARLAKSMQVCKSSLPDNGARLFSEEVGYLMVVADGMGGAAAGEHASALAVATVEDFALNTLKWFLHLGAAEEHALLAELRAGLEQADRAVIDRARSDPRLHGMGTTLTMAYSVGTDLYIVHAGDTRAYIFHDGELQQVTTDHTLVQLLKDHGGLSAEDARRHKRRNVVTNVIGGPSAGVHSEVHKLGMADGDILLLCSDGLSEPVGDDAIAAALAEYAEPEAASQALIDLALAKGAPDNVTAVVVKYKFE